MSCNPWLVENVQEFSFLNCPECVFKVKEEDIFQDHAVRNHSQSSVLFGQNSISEFITIKTEPSNEMSSGDFDYLLSSNVDEITGLKSTSEEQKVDPLGGISQKKEMNVEELTIPEPDPDEEIPAKRRKFSSNSEPNEDAGYEKPCMTHAQLIAEALNNAPEQTLVLSDIYKAINVKHPYYELETKGWQNSIRHNLTMNENFMKHSDKRGWFLNLSKDVPIPHLETKQHTAS